MRLLPVNLRAQRAALPTLVVVVTLLGGCYQDPAGVEDDGSGSTSATASSTAPVPAGDTDSVQTDSPPTSVALVVTSALVGDDVVEVTAFVEGLVELGGTCQAVVTTSGGTVSSDPVEAEPGASTTDCGAMTAAVDGGSATTVTVTYSSSTQDLTSTPTEVELP